MDNVQADLNTIAGVNLSSLGGITTLSEVVAINNLGSGLIVNGATVSLSI